MPINEDFRQEFEQNLRKENDAHELIVELCNAKNVGLFLSQEGKTGHCEIPELWTLEKPLPLNADEISILSEKTFPDIDYKNSTDETFYVR